MTRLLFALCLALATLNAQGAPGWGAWVREDDLTAANMALFPAIPAFLVMKAGVFDKRGNMKFVAKYDRVIGFCRKNVEMHAWVTYHIGVKTTLSRPAGQNLGAELNKLLDQSCFSTIELDIEPLNAPAPGMIEFLEEVRRVMRPDRKLLLALPPVAPPEPRGLRWLESDLKKVLAHVDGIDLMLYDTAAEREMYEQILRRAVEVAKTYPTKQFRLGLPAYYDKRNSHPLGVESSTVAVETLRALLSTERETLCSPSVRILYYAYWTMKKEDFENARALDTLLKERCAERPKGARVTPLR